MGKSGQWRFFQWVLKDFQGSDDQRTVHIEELVGQESPCTANFSNALFLDVLIDIGVGDPIDTQGHRTDLVVKRIIETGNPSGRGIIPVQSGLLLYGIVSLEDFGRGVQYEHQAVFRSGVDTIGPSSSQGVVGRNDQGLHICLGGWKYTGVDLIVIDGLQFWVTAGQYNCDCEENICFQSIHDNVF